MSTSYFHKISFHYFEDYFNEETELRVRYSFPYKQSQPAEANKTQNNKTKEGGQQRAVFHGAEMGK